MRSSTSTKALHSFMITGSRLNKLLLTNHKLCRLCVVKQLNWPNRPCALTESGKAFRKLKFEENSNNLADVRSHLVEHNVITVHTSKQGLSRTIFGLDKGNDGRFGHMPEKKGKASAVIITSCFLDSWCMLDAKSLKMHCFANLPATTAPHTPWTTLRGGKKKKRKRRKTFRSARSRSSLSYLLYTVLLLSVLATKSFDWHPSARNHHQRTRCRVIGQ